VAELDQRVRDASGAAAEVEHSRVRMDRRVHDLRLAQSGQLTVEVDGATVGGELSGSGARGLDHLSR